ncbi:MAG: ABC transporter substrate-binding protein [Thermodesulfobacteriota bacterium]|nr:ABC transporter substrate-binding protein [Thermodesulfobacteriota bacterium]
MTGRCLLRKGIHCFLSIMGCLIFTLILNQTVYSEKIRGVTGTTIKIGAILDMTGPLATATIQAAEGKRNYTRFINDNGGINGRKVEFIVEDDRYSIPVGIAAFKKLVFKDGVFAMMGPYNTGTVKALFGQIEKLKIPIVAFPGHPSLVIPVRKYLFLTGEFYDDDVGVIFDYIMKELKPKDLKISYCTFDGESGKEVLGLVKKWTRFFKYDRPIHREIIQLGALEASSQVMSMKREGITHIFVHYPPTVAALLLRELRKFGIKIPVFGSLMSCSEDTVKLGGKASKNYIGAMGMSSWYDDTPGMEKVREITLKYHPGTDKPWRSKFYTGGWVVTTLLYEGIARAGRDLTPDSCVQALENIKNFDTQGLCSPVTFSATNHKGSNAARLFKADPSIGKLVPITDWRDPPKIQ